MVDKTGISIESALLEFAFKMGYDYEKYRVSSRIKKVYPFNSKQKRMITVFLKKQGMLRVYFKGSPELILDKCTEYRNKDGLNTKLNS
jgi:Ca2+-transporting ATPase